MPYRFSGGVRDIEGHRGYVSVGAGIAAVDLANGAVLWRRSRIGRPLAATGPRLLTLDRDGDQYVLRLFDARTGADTGRITDFGMPAWAAEAGMEADAVQIEASEHPAGIQIAWRVRRPYRGGAPPPSRIAAKAQHECTGAVVVDPDGGRGTAVPTDGYLEAAPEPRDLGPHATPSPDVVAFERVGHRLFALKAQAQPGQPARIALEARDARDGSTIWEAPLAETDSLSPPPRRK